MMHRDSACTKPACFFFHSCIAADTKRCCHIVTGFRVTNSVYCHLSTPLFQESRILSSRTHWLHRPVNDSAGHWERYPRKRLESPPLSYKSNTLFSSTVINTSLFRPKLSFVHLKFIYLLSSWIINHLPGVAITSTAHYEHYKKKIQTH
jgi:hypothetical protein